MSGKSLAAGKVPPESLLRTIYSRIGKPNPRLLLGPGIGRDVAIVKNNPLLVLTTDPVTGTSTRIGEHSVYINANDTAAAGAEPVWYLCTILLPIGSTEKTLSEIMQGIDRVSRKLGITVARGHTEITKHVDRPLIAGFMIGERHGKLLRAEDARAGDVILMTKTAGIEGTAIIAHDYPRSLKRTSPEFLRRAKQFSSKISIVQEAKIISKIHGIRVMHDPTEGGVLNACWELGESSHLGVDVSADKIPVSNETLTICSSLGLDPLKLMSSGCLLAVIAPASIHKALASLQRARVQATVIGKIEPISEGRKYTLKGKKSNLVPVPRDELYKLA